MLSNHLNMAVDGNVYCHRLMSVVPLTYDHFNEHCKGCPYFQGTYQGQGVECKYEDAHATQSLTIVDDPQQQAAFMGALSKGARRGGIYNLDPSEQELFGIEDPVEKQFYLDSQAEEEAQRNKQRLLETLRNQDAALLRKLKAIQFDPTSPVSEIDVEQHLNSDQLVARWASDHPYFRGTIIARVSGVVDNAPTLEERGYYLRFGWIERFPEFGSVYGPQRDQVLRRIGFYGDPPSNPKLDMAVAKGALVKIKRDGRVGRVDRFSEEMGRLIIMVRILDLVLPFTLDEIEPVMVKAAVDQDRDAKGRFAFMGTNSPQPPEKEGEHTPPDALSPTEVMTLVLQSKNHQKHLADRDPEDRERWIERYKAKWVGDKPFKRVTIDLEKMNYRKVDYNEQAVIKKMFKFPYDKPIVIAPDTTDHEADFVILDGNHTVEAARRLEMKEIEAYVREDGLERLQ